jgi:hypothetical protein
LNLAKEESAAARARQEKFDPQFQQIIDQSLTSQKTQGERSAALFDEWGGAADIRESFYNDARTFDTPGRRDEAGAAARAAVETESNMQRQAQQRSLGRSGASLSSGHALALDNSTRLATARASAGADADARRKVEATGLSLKDNAAKTSMGLPSTGLQAASLALGAGGAAGGAIAQGQGVYNASLAPTMGLYQGAGNSSTQSGNLYGNIANIQSQQQGSGLSALMGLGQTAGIMYGSGMFSSKRFKRKVGGSSYASSKEKKNPVGPRRASGDVEDARILSETPTADAVAAVPTQGWQYKGEAGNTLGRDVHVGPYAEDVQASMGEGAAPGGEMIDGQQMAEHNAAAIAELAKRADRMEAELGIAA